MKELTIFASVSSLMAWALVVTLVSDVGRVRERLTELETQVSLSRLEHTSTNHELDKLYELVDSVDEEAHYLSGYTSRLTCKVDLLVSISRVGWWDKTVLDGLRRCSTQPIGAEQ